MLVTRWSFKCNIHRSHSIPLISINYFFTYIIAYFNVNNPSVSAVTCFLYTHALEQIQNYQSSKGAYAHTKYALFFSSWLDGRLGLLIVEVSI